MTERLGGKVHDISRQFGNTDGRSQVNHRLPKILSSVPKLCVECPESFCSSPFSYCSSNSSRSSSSKSLFQTSSAGDPLTEDGDYVTEMTSPTVLPRENAILSTLSPTMKQPSPVHVIGLDLLQEQVRRIALRKGFTLNLMVLGRSGLGKSTLINTLFRAAALPHENNIKTTVAKTTDIRTTHTPIEEKGIKLDLTVTDTPGFGDHIDNTDCWQPALEYIDDQYEKYLIEEQNPNRMRSTVDTRIHCCLYFIPPTGHSLRPLDLEVLKRLHKVVNVIPVIAKADTLTLEERHEFKCNIQRDLKEHEVEIYPSARYEHVEDHDTNQTYRNLTPFAVVGSENVYKNEAGHSVLGRLNSWGLIQIEDPQHCEFHHLRDLLIRNRMQDLIELTSDIHYENFRRRRLLEMKTLPDLSSLNESHI